MNEKVKENIASTLAWQCILSACPVGGIELCPLSDDVSCITVQQKDWIDYLSKIGKENEHLS